MKKAWTRLVLLLCGAALILGAAGCSNDDGGPPLTDVTGSWVTTTWISAYVPGPTVNVTWSLTQNGSAIYGSFVDSLSQRGTVSGSISGYTVFLTFQYYSAANKFVDYEATAGATSMSGTFRGEGQVILGNANRLLTQ